MEPLSASVCFSKKSRSSEDGSSKEVTRIWQLGPVGATTPIKRVDCIMHQAAGLFMRFLDHGLYRSG
jgi:hypothetical protein